MKTSERLFAAVKDIWAQYDTHPFVTGMRDGTLDREKFRFYIMQDYLYLESYGRVFAVGIAKARTPELTQIFAHYLNMLTGAEMDLHRGYMGLLGITRKDLDAMPLALDNRSYTSYMLRVAYEDGEVETLTSILSCAWSYEYIARNMLRANAAAAEDPFYGDWVKGYVSERYAQDNVVLIDALDRLSADYNEAQLAHLEEIFVACSRYELAFWDMAWERKL